MKKNSILKQAVCAALILSCFSATYAKDKDDKDKKKGPGKKDTSDARPAGGPSGGPPSKPSGGPSKSGPSPAGPSRSAPSGPSRSAGPQIARSAGPRIVEPARRPGVVLDIRPGLFSRPRPSPVMVAPQRVSSVAVQRALAERGYYYGAIDGQIGPMSRRAIAAFQAEAGLPPTGEITSSLLRALRL